MWRGSSSRAVESSSRVVQSRPNTVESPPHGPPLAWVPSPVGRIRRRTRKGGRDMALRLLAQLLYCCGKEGAGSKLDDASRRGRQQGWRAQCRFGGGDARGGVTGWEVRRRRPPGELFLHSASLITAASCPTIPP
jgi:hypothetical protein